MVDTSLKPRPSAFWWLDPRFLILCFAVPLLIGAYLIPEDAYILLYRTAKHIDLHFLAVGLLLYAAFLAGTFCPVRVSVQPQERDVYLYCRWVIWPLFVMTMFGYVVWFTYSLVQAGGPGPLLSALSDFVLRSREGINDYIKFEVFQTIPGITTFTQFGILYATVEALLWVRGGSRRNVALVRITPVVMLTLVRAVLLSERLALVELAVPVAVVFLSHARLTRVSRPLVRFAPVLGGFIVFLLFAFAEYFRSWIWFQAIYPGPYLRFAVERFLGYYATALNNAAVYYYYVQIQPLRHTLNSLFTFPVLGDEAREAIYHKLLGIEIISHLRLLETYANPEFNNLALIGRLLNEFAFLAPFAAFFIGLVSFSLYKSFTRGRLIGLILYPSWFVGLLEIPRLYYWASQRYFPTLAFLAISLLLFRTARVAVAKQQEQMIAMEAPPAIEQEMAEIRSRMVPDLSDLREHVGLQAIKEQVKRSLRERLRGNFSLLKPTSRRR